MVPDTYHDFFLASVGASAALIGLLFVAISVSPERVFGTEAQGERLTFAVSAFIALGNIFFISLAGLLPYPNIGVTIVAAGGSGIINTFLLILDIWQRRLRRGARSWTLLLGGLAIYMLEVWWGIELLRHPARVSALENVTIVLLVAYAVALARAWELLGGQDYSLIRTAIALIRGKGGRAEESTADEHTS
jgi:hypothetical protein